MVNKKKKKLEYTEKLKERDRIIFGKEQKWGDHVRNGGIERFDDLDLKRLKKLIRIGVAKKEDYHNECPDIASMLDFLKLHPGFVLTGFVVSPFRDDCRTSIDGIRFDGDVDIDLLVEFADTFKFSTDWTLSSTHLSAWYD